MSSRNRTNPATPYSDPVSAEAPGVRTEAEVVADEQATADQATQSAPPGATGNPAINDDIPAEVNTDKLVHYLRESDGTVQSVNEGSVEHRILAHDAEFTKTTRAKAKAAGIRSFTRTAKATA